MLKMDCTAAGTNRMRLNTTTYYYITTQTDSYFDTNRKNKSSELKKKSLSGDLKICLIEYIPRLLPPFCTKMHQVYASGAT